MMQNIVNNNIKTNKLFVRLTAEKKKALLAFSLIMLMAFMWIRVLGNKTPKAAEAALPEQQKNSDELSQIKISFIELPKVLGRNDVITRDFFDSNKWYGFINENVGNLTGYEEVSVVSKNRNNKIIRSIQGKVKLEAIELGEKPSAFINGELMLVGDKLQIKDGIDVYECEIVRIEENMVFLRCAEVEIELRLMPDIEVTDR